MKDSEFVLLLKKEERKHTYLLGVLRKLISSYDEGFKNSDAVSLGRRGGKIGGLARAASLSKERRSEIAKIAAKKRWNNPTQAEND